MALMSTTIEVINTEEENLTPEGLEIMNQIREQLEVRGLGPKDLWPVVGSKSRVSEILAGERAMTKEQAKKLAEFFHIDRKSVVQGKSVDLGGRRIIKKK